MERIQPCKANERAWAKPPYQPAQPGMPEVLSIMHQLTRGKNDQHACTQSQICHNITHTYQDPHKTTNQLQHGL